MNKDKKVLGFLYRKRFYIKYVFKQLKKTTQNQTKPKGSTCDYIFQQTKVKGAPKTNKQKTKAHFWIFSVGDPKCLGTKRLRQGLEGFRCDPVSMIKLV